MWRIYKKNDLYLTASRCAVAGSSLKFICPNAVWPFRKVTERIDSALDDNISSDTSGY